MDSNNRFQTKVYEDIGNKLFLKAITSLSERINKSSDNSQSPEAADTRLHYYLLRSYCYYKLGSDEALESAIDDVFRATDLDANRFQPYLLGALILWSMKRWDQSLQMFEKSIEIKPNLFEIFVHKLIYLKFKILAIRGHNEELSLRCALKYRYLDDCLQKMSHESDKNDSDILRLVVNHNKQSLNSDSILNNFFVDSNNDKSSGSASDSIDFSDLSNLSKLLRQKAKNQFLSGGDQQFIQSFKSQNNQMTDRLVNNSIKSRAKAKDSDDEDFFEDWGQPPKPKDTLRADPKPHIKNNSLNNWIERNQYRLDSASRMCSFDGSPPPAPDVPVNPQPNRQPFESFGASNRRNSTPSDNESINLEDLSVTSRPPSVFESCSLSRETATNLLKLRGIYIGNLKAKCDQKKLKDTFKKYGTIVDLYQPWNADYAFIHYNNHEAALQMLNEWKARPFSEAKDGKKLMVRFTPSQEQMQKYNSLTVEEYKKRCTDAGECDLWRSGQRCPLGFNCSFAHTDINRAVDTLPEKRKAKWKCT